MQYLSFSARVGVFFVMFSSESNYHNLIHYQLGRSRPLLPEPSAFSLALSVNAANKVNSLYYLTLPLAR